MSDFNSSEKLPVAVFLSGSGRTLANLIEHRDQHGLPIDIRLVISSRSDVRGVEIARQDGIETLIIRQRDYPDANGYSAAMFAPLGKRKIEYVVMAGFLKHVLIPDAFANRVLNIHPSLLPGFGGQGMYGHHVHAAAIERGVKITGCTVHFVDNEYDHGPILHQRACPVLSNDTPDTLAARVFEQECLALPEAIRMIADGVRTAV